MEWATLPTSQRTTHPTTQPTNCPTNQPTIHPSIHPSIHLPYSSIITPSLGVNRSRERITAL
ncbi:MAG: PT domain-containing protein [Anaerolineales bacterium]|nr:PT domain-containing protein [Anaerolineales bacterium]